MLAIEGDRLQLLKSPPAGADTGTTPAKVLTCTIIYHVPPASLKKGGSKSYGSSHSQNPSPSKNFSNCRKPNPPVSLSTVKLFRNQCPRESTVPFKETLFLLLTKFSDKSELPVLFQNSAARLEDDRSSRMLLFLRGKEFPRQQR